MNGFGPKKVTPLVIYLFNLFITKCLFILQTKHRAASFGLRRGADEPPTDLRTRSCRVDGGMQQARRPWNCPLFPKVFRKKNALSAYQRALSNSAAWMWIVICSLMSVRILVKTWRIFSHLLGYQPVREAVSYRGLFTAGWFGVREKHCCWLEIYDRLRASEQAEWNICNWLTYVLIYVVIRWVNFWNYFQKLQI